MWFLGGILKIKFNTGSHMSFNFNQAYSVGQPTTSVFPLPIIANRAPATTDKGYPLGQIWIDQSVDSIYALVEVSNGSATWTSLGGGTIAVDKLTGDTGTALPVAGNINILGNPDIQVTGSGSTLQMTDRVKFTAFVVSSVAGEAPYSTIQSALNAANTAGGGVVLVRPGSYTENLLLFPNTQVIGAVGLYSPSGTVTITGTHSLLNAFVPGGDVVFANLNLISSSDIFNTNAAGTGTLTVYNCSVTLNGFIFNSNNWVGNLNIISVTSDSTTNQVITNDTGGATVVINNSSLGSSPLAMITSGDLFVKSSSIGCAIVSLTGNATATLSHSKFTGEIDTTSPVDLVMDNCECDVGANSAIVHSSVGTVVLRNVSINSSVTNAIAGTGAGTIVLTDVSFEDSKGIAGTLTVSTQGSVSCGGINIIEGTDARMGRAILGAGGTVVVNTNRVTNASEIFLTSQVDGGTPGFLRVTARTAGTSFTISSSNAADTSTVAWEIKEPA